MKNKKWKQKYSLQTINDAIEKYLEGWTQTEIARSHGVSRNSVSLLFIKTLPALRDKIEAMEEKRKVERKK
jgi:DNA-binding transcriptional regulator LsrR (DeoR family)